MAHALALFAFGLVREPRLWAATGAGRAERPLWRAATSRAPRAAPRCSDDALEQFRRQLQRQMSDDGTAFNPLGAPGRFDLWATPHERVETGVVLFADFRAWQEGASTAAAAPFDQFALRGPLPRDLPADMIARVLPVIIVVSQGANGAHEALLLERRTGVMLGDMKGDEYACAPINTLWFGGTASRESVSVLAQSDGPAAPEGLSAVFSGVSVGPWAKARPLIEAGKITGSRSFVFAGKTGARQRAGALPERPRPCWPRVAAIQVLTRRALPLPPTHRCAPVPYPAATTAARRSLQAGRARAAVCGRLLEGGAALARRPLQGALGAIVAQGLQAAVARGARAVRGRARRARAGALSGERVSAGATPATAPNSAAHIHVETASDLFSSTATCARTRQYHMRRRPV
jgi:hypothetical protein